MSKDAKFTQFIVSKLTNKSSDFYQSAFCKIKIFYFKKITVSTTVYLENSYAESLPLYLNLYHLVLH